MVKAFSVGEILVPKLQSFNIKLNGLRNACDKQEVGGGGGWFESYAPGLASCGLDRLKYFWALIAANK